MFTSVLGVCPSGGHPSLHRQLVAQGEMRSWQLFPRDLELERLPWILLLFATLSHPNPAVAVPLKQLLTHLWRTALCQEQCAEVY